MQASGRVDDDHVLAARLRRFDGVVGHCGGVAALLRADDVGLRPLGPDLQLLVRRGAKRVARGQDDREAVLAQLVGELADRRRLAGAVDPDDENHARPLVDGEARGAVALEQCGRLLDQGFGHVARELTRLEPLHELGRGGNAHVGRDERLLEPLPRLVVRWVEGLERQLLGQRPAALAERVAQTPEEAGALRLGPRRLFGVAQ